jgi:polysaccharide pyruvyl transferase WcaK-like protein
MKILTKKVLFAGSYGLKNAGDELPLILLCENLKNNAPNINFEFTTFSRHPSKDDEIKYDIKFIKNLEYESRKESFNKSFKGFNHGDKQDDLVRVVNQIKNCDLLILGAGNIFHDKTIDLFRGPIPLIALYVYFAKVYHKKIMIYGSSVTPLKTGLGKELSSYIIENSDIITLRDEESKLELQKILSKPKTIMVLPDSTLGATKPEQDLIDKLFKREKIPLGKKYMGISLRDLNAVLPSNQTEIIWEQLIDTLNELKHKFIFIFVPQVTYKEDDDRIIAQKLCKRLDADVEFHIIKK